MCITPHLMRLSLFLLGFCSSTLLQAQYIELAEAPDSTQLIFSYEQPHHTVVDTFYLKDGAVQLPASACAQAGLYRLYIPALSEATYFLTDGHTQIHLQGDYYLFPEILHARKSPLNQKYFAYRNALRKVPPSPQQGALITQLQAEHATQASAPLLRQLIASEQVPYHLRQALYAYRAHYFDGITWDTPALFSFPSFTHKLKTYLERLYPAQVDSQRVAIDFLLQKTEHHAQVRKHLLQWLIIHYQQSKQLNMDVLFVELSKRFLCAPQASAVFSELRTQTYCAEAAARAPILQGQQLPDFQWRTLSGAAHNLYQIQADYTVLILGDPDCAHCLEANQMLRPVFEAYKDKSVAFVSICTAGWEKRTRCQDLSLPWPQYTLPQTKLLEMEAYLQAQYSPTIYLLDKNKKIRWKWLNATQLQQILASYFL